MSPLVRHLLAAIGLVVLVGLYLVDARLGWASLTAVAAYVVAQDRRTLDGAGDATRPA